MPKNLHLFCFCLLFVSRDFYISTFNQNQNFQDAPDKDLLRNSNRFISRNDKVGFEISVGSIKPSMNTFQKVTLIALVFKRD